METEVKKSNLEDLAEEVRKEAIARVGKVGDGTGKVEWPKDWPPKKYGREDSDSRG